MTGFGIEHLPYGIASSGEGTPHVAVRYGDAVLDLYDALGDEVFAAPTLNPFMAQGGEAWARTRTRIVDALGGSPSLVPLEEVTLHLPFEVADYVDFYCSIEHATNVGRIFRPDGEALMPNWRHLPVGYHGRAGTVVVSGTDVVRPCGQRKAAEEQVPSYGPSRRLDIEAEVGFVVGTPSRLGDRVPTSAFADHVFGVTLVNDWSARDIQAWEYVPLGPFLGKSFATSISPWITPLAALDGARAALPGQEPAPLDYLQVTEPAGYALDLEVELNGEVVSRPPYAAMYWSPAQMLAHLTVNGASLRTGDLYASGTVSGAEREQRGSLLELSWGGREPFPAGARERTFLEDGDEVVLRATAPAVGGGRLTLGEVSGRIAPARC